MTVTPLTPQMASELDVSETEGLVITGVDPESAAAEKGLAAGDVITEANQQSVATVADLEARIEEAREAGRRSVLMLIRRGGEPLFLALPLEQEDATAE